MKRKGIYKKIVSALSAAVFAVTCVSSVMTYAEDDDLAADLKRFDDKNQEQIVYDMGAGINLGNQFEAVNTDGYPSETAWGNPVITKELVKQIHDSGFNTIRLPVSYFLRIGDGPDYIIEEAWLDRIQEVVDYAYELGMYVIMNMHGDGYYTIDNSWLLLGDYADINPRRFSTDEEYQQAVEKEQARVDAMVDKYEKVWTQVAERYKDYDEHIIFESMNEMQSKQTGTTYAKRFYPVLNRLNQTFVDAVRKTGSNNAKRWLLIPGWFAELNKILNDEIGFVIPSDDYKSSEITENRLFISIHFYEPSDFCLNETPERTTWGKESDYTNIETQFKAAYDKFISNGYPIIIGEYGAVNKSAYDPDNTMYRHDMYKAICAAARKYGLVPVAWDNGYTGNYGLGLFNRASATVAFQEVIDGIMEVYNADNLVSGTIHVSDEAENEELSIKVVSKDGLYTAEASAVSMESYSINNLSDGEYTITVGSKKYAPRTYDITLNSQVIELDITLNLYGDINGDGKVSTADVGITNSSVKGMRSLTDYEFICADVSLDGRITTSDVGRINAHAKGTKSLW